jgi:hypothetical protein
LVKPESIISLSAGDALLKIEIGGITLTAYAAAFSARRFLVVTDL